MSVQLRPTLSLALMLSLSAACAEEEPGFPYDMGGGPSIADSGVPPAPGDDAQVTPPPAWPIGDASTPDAAFSPVDTGVPPDDADVEPDAAPMGDGDCCPDGNCLCHGPDPMALTSAAGPYETAQLRLPLGTVTYPTDAEPPFASVAIVGGFTNTGPEMAEWAPFYASHGIVAMIVTTGGLDFPDIRSNKLLAGLTQLKAENEKSGSPLAGKLDTTRLGTSGYSMGGGGTTLASIETPTLKSSVSLAGWQPATSGITVPTLLLCGTADGTAPCSGSQRAYAGISDPIPKMLVAIDGASHFNWFGPTGAGRGISGQYALAFQKVFLEGDTRWEDVLKSRVTGSTQTTNIQ